MPTVRLALVDDAEAIEEVRGASWRAAYAGKIDEAVIEMVVTDGQAHPRDRFSQPANTILVAESVDQQVVGFAVIGPERLDGRPVPAGQTKRRALEIYAIYVHPAHWGTGAGRLLMNQSLSRIAAVGYHRATLWVLETNDRARRFYQRAGFAPTGHRQTLERLGGVVEVHYAREV